MIIWLNGAFGAGKSTAAERLCQLLPDAYVYDPEQVGYFLWDIFPADLKRRDNFQHLPLWREFNYKILKHISENYNGVIVTPMTVYIRAYYDEIIGKLLADGVEVKNFILTASRQTLVGRLARRGDDGGWGAQHIDQCLSAFAHDIPGHPIDTENKSIDGICHEIINAAGTMTDNNEQIADNK